MKQKIILLVLIFIMMFGVITNIKADFEVNSSLNSGEESKACSSNYCASTVYGYYGLQATLMKKNSSGKLEQVVSPKKILNSDFTFNKPKNCNCGSSKYCTSTTSEINYCWKDYFDNLTANELGKILKKINSSYTLTNTSSYYLRLVPLVKIAYKNPQGTFYFNGTHNEVVDGMRSYKSYGGSNSWNNTIAIHFTERTGASTQEGSYISGPWNVLKNYYTAFKMSTGDFQYTTTYTSDEITARSAKSFSDAFSSSIYGKIIIKISDYAPSKIKITIKDRVTNQVITNPNRQAEYQVYTGENCTGKAIGSGLETSSGIGFKEGLTEGTYSIKELSHPSGYVKSSNDCVKTKVQVSGTETPVEIYYDPTCQTELDDSNKTIPSLMDIYNRHKKRGLLNFSSPSCSNKKDDLCEIDEIKNDSLKCLKASNILNTIFDQNNLSCYDQIVTGNNGEIGFCSTNFSLKNGLGTNSFSGYGGQFLIRKEASDSIATATTLKTCYIYNKGIYSSYQNIKSNRLFFGDNNDDGEVDELKSTLDSTKIIDKVTDTPNGYFKKYEFGITKNYHLNPVYLERFTGKYKSTMSNNTLQEPIYGILAKFKNNDSYIPFKLIYDGTEYTSEDCKYKTKDQVITYEKDENGKLDLEFRPIDKNEPFSRDTNSNWCDETSCDLNNNTVTSIIKNRNDSYNSTQAGAIYTITLRPEDIKIIRKYNKDNKYSYYQMIINDDDEFVNSFVHDLKLGEIKKYKENGNVEKTYGVLSNKLIAN